MGFFKKLVRAVKQVVRTATRVITDPTGDRARSARRQEGEAQDARNRAEASERAAVQRSAEERKKRQMEESEERRASRRGLRGSRRSLLTGDDRGQAPKDITG